MAENKLLYEYAVIRVVPRVERDEFINAGLILYCKKQDVLLCKTFLHQTKLLCLDEQADCETIAHYLEAFERIASGNCPENVLSKADKPARFRWLTAAKSTIIQCSPVHPGLADDVQQAFKDLCKKLVH